MLFYLMDFSLFLCLIVFFLSGSPWYKGDKRPSEPSSWSMIQALVYDSLLSNTAVSGYAIILWKMSANFIGAQMAESL